MIQNFASFNYFELAAIFGETNLNSIDSEWECRGVSTDTRTLAPGNIFVALTGEKIDGHSLVADAIQKGAAGAVVSKDWFEENRVSVETYPLIIVDDTQEALGQLGAYHRQRFEIPIIAIAGSNGKTTTKELTAAALSSKFKVLKTYENFNNQIGVPMMLLCLSDEYKAAVIEMGTNEPGEIQILSSMVQPTHGLITNIGREHLEKLIDMDGVEMEEAFLFGNLKKTGGLAFVNFDDPRLRKYIPYLDKCVSYGTDEKANICCTIEFDEELNPAMAITYDEKKYYLKPNARGYTIALNALAATAVGLAFGVDFEGIKSSIESYTQQTSHGYGRMAVESIGEITLLNDCYNANPDSMAAALTALKLIKQKGRKIAVLGDMREMGESSETEHINLIRSTVETADIILLTGDEMKKALLEFKNAGKIRHFDEKSDLSKTLINIISTGDAVLVKASRGIRLESVVEEIKKELSK